MSALPETLLGRLRRQGDTWPIVCAMLITAVLLAGLQYLQLDYRFSQDMQTRAHMIARTASAAVVFGDRKDAADILQAFDSSPEVLSARIVLPDGTPFVENARPTPAATWRQQLGGRATAEAEITANGRVVGRLVVTSARWNLWESLLVIMLGAVMIMTAAFVATRLLSQRLRARVRRAEDRTEYLAHHDALTGLVNRSRFSAALDEALQQVGRQPRTAAILWLDIDNFKLINDTHGHGAGDSALVAVAQRLREIVRTDDVVSRLGGDEFAVLLQPPASEQAAARIAAAMTARPCTHVAPNGARLELTTSIGIALVPRDAADAGGAMRCADIALYAAKRNGKNGFAVYSAEMGELQRQRVLVENDLRQAIQENQLCLHYQPIFDRDGVLQSFEGLARWNHPARGWIAPSEFIPVAEEAGLIGSLAFVCLRRLRGDLDSWRAQGLAAMPVAINLSSHQFRTDTSRVEFLQQLDEVGLGPDEVEFELTEGAIFHEIDSPESIVSLLHGRGYRLALDDFGTGYSSLAYLLRLRCRKLKIDRVFVDRISTRPDARLLADSIIRVAHAIGMVTVAEGVETQADQQCLIELGCDQFQGFGLSRPVSAEQAGSLLAAHATGARTFAASAAEPVAVRQGPGG